MAKMVITHAVVDVERWLQGKSERVAEFGTFATNVTDHVAADGSNNVAITADIHDMTGLQAHPWSARPHLSSHSASTDKGSGSPSRTSTQVQPGPT